MWYKQNKMSFKHKVISIQKQGVNFDFSDRCFSVFDSNLKGLDIYHHELNCIFLLNDNTNRQMLFVLSETKMNRDNDIQYWFYKPTLEAVAEKLDIKGLYIWNS